jgi:DNA-binding PadR family transcriptional regulator
MKTLFFQQAREQLHGHHNHDCHRGGPRGRGPRGRRGDAKYFILEALAERPRHGYDIMSAVEEKTGFRPSPGTVYPTLQMLEEGGFITGADREGKRVYTITPTGIELLGTREPAAEDTPDFTEDPRFRLKAAFFKLGMAVRGVRGGDPETHERIREILETARRDVYAVLAEDRA